MYLLKTTFVLGLFLSMIASISQVAIASTESSENNFFDGSLKSSCETLDRMRDMDYLSDYKENHPTEIVFRTEHLGL
ncbi:MAG: hypothetical protein VX642_08125, partial [Bdellovibrionota bacterium]|nr:hypothetical protein [Bdellovibrionota bacterium]